MKTPSIMMMVLMAGLTMSMLVSPTMGQLGLSWSALTMQVEPKVEECVYADLPPDYNFEMDFEVVRGGLLDIRLTITAPASSPSPVVFDRTTFFNRDDETNEQQGQVRFKTTAQSAGVHNICFNNKMSRWTAKVVSFAIKGSGPDDTKEHAKLEHLGPVVDSVIKISEELDQIERLQHHMRVREQIHRDTQESTNSRVQYLALIESVVLIGLNLLQLHYIRSWFAESGQRRRV